MEPNGIAGFALPDHENAPAKPPQLAPVALIARDVAKEFGAPIGCVGFRYSGIKATGLGMQMPEAAMNKDDLAGGTKDEIRFAW